MLEFLLDPAVVALYGTVGGGVAIKVLDNFNSKAKQVEAGDTNKPKKVKRGKKEVKTIHHCAKYFDREFEKKLVDAGVIRSAQMTVCEDEECPNCEGTRFVIQSEENAKQKAKRDADRLEDERRRYETMPAFQRFQWLKKNDPRYKGYTFKDYEFQEKVRAANKKRQEIEYKKNLELHAKEYMTESYCLSCEEYSPKPHAHFYGEGESKSKSVTPKALPQRSRVVELGDGLTVTRPANVPSFAKTQAYYKHGAVSGIEWSWSYDDTGILYYRQPLTVETYEMKDDGGTVRKMWAEVYDSDSGEHLGTVAV